jgi:hypothetical protein
MGAPERRPPYPFSRRTEVVERYACRKKAERHARSSLSIELADDPNPSGERTTEDTNLRSFFEHRRNHTRLFRLLTAHTYHGT